VVLIEKEMKGSLNLREAEFRKSQLSHHVEH
jgi:hypothetical protein